MINQDLFNKRTKTFMDYEPSKILSKNLISQVTTQTKPQDQFPSNIKIVGDNVTEKDYEAFLEGFKSARENPLREERQLSQKPKIQQAPYRPSVYGEQKIQNALYRPSVDGEQKIQKLPYRPSEDGGAKISLYSGATPAYTQAKNTSQKPEETWQDKRKETKENRERNEDLLQNIYAAKVMTTAGNPLSGLLRIAVGRALEDHVKEKHYSRNQYNVDLPTNKDEAKEWDWKTVAANCHQFTAENGERYIKYVSPDGKREVIFNEKGEIVITADEDEGTYNYADPDLWLAHFIVDVLPWIRYGNTPEDPTKWYQRVGGLFNFEE